MHVYKLTDKLGRQPDEDMKLISSDLYLHAVSLSVFAVQPQWDGCRSGAQPCNLEHGTV